MELSVPDSPIFDFVPGFSTLLEDKCLKSLEKDGNDMYSCYCIISCVCQLFNNQKVENHDPLPSPSSSSPSSSSPSPSSSSPSPSSSPCPSSLSSCMSPPSSPSSLILSPMSPPSSPSSLILSPMSPVSSPFPSVLRKTRISKVTKPKTRISKVTKPKTEKKPSSRKTKNYVTLSEEERKYWDELLSRNNTTEIAEILAIQSHNYFITIKGTFVIPNESLAECLILRKRKQDCIAQQKVREKKKLKLQQHL